MLSNYYRYQWSDGHTNRENHLHVFNVFYRDSLVGYQASPRGGTVGVTVGQGVGGNRVTLKGEAVTVFRGLFRRWFMHTKRVKGYAIPFLVPYLGDDKSLPLVGFPRQNPVMLLARDWCKNSSGDRNMHRWGVGMLEPCPLTAIWPRNVWSPEVIPWSNVERMLVALSLSKVRSTEWIFMVKKMGNAEWRLLCLYIVKKYVRYKVYSSHTDLRPPQFACHTYGKFKAFFPALP